MHGGELLFVEVAAVVDGFWVVCGEAHCVRGGQCVVDGLPAPRTSPAFFAKPGLFASVGAVSFAVSAHGRPLV